MPATFYELHKVEKKITKALEALEDAEDREKVLAAVLSLNGLAVAQK